MFLYQSGVILSCHSNNLPNADSHQDDKVSLVLFIIAFYISGYSCFSL